MYTSSDQDILHMPSLLKSRWIECLKSISVLIVWLTYQSKEKKTKTSIKSYRKNRLKKKPRSKLKTKRWNRKGKRHDLLKINETLWRSDIEQNALKNWKQR